MLDCVIDRDINVIAAVTELEAQPDLWSIFTARQNAPGSAHADTECIILRGPREFIMETVFTDLKAFDDRKMTARLPATSDLVKHVLMNNLSAYKEIGRIMIVRLKIGGYISNHWDSGDYAAHYERFHLVLTSDPGNIFKTWSTDPPSSFIPWPGMLFKFPHLANHEVWNLSDASRIHVIIDARKA